MGILKDLYNLTQPDLKVSGLSAPPAAPPRLQPNTTRHFNRSSASLKGTMQTWVNHVVSARMAERQKRRTADRAGDLYTNDALSHGLIESLLIDIVNTGLTPQSQPMLRWLGFGQEWQREYQERNYDLFELWGLDPRNWCDAQRRMNIYMLQAHALFCWQLDGMGVYQVIQKPTGFCPLSLSLLPIDPDRLETPVDLKTRDDVYDGIVLDTDGAPTAAWIRQKGYRGSARTSDCVKVEVEDEETGLPKLLLVCDVRNVAEYRQDSILGPNMKEIRDSNDLADAAVVKTLISNLITLFIEDSLELSGQNTSGSFQDRILQIESGTILFGQAGQKPYSIGNDSPGPGYRDMQETIIGRVGMATNRGPEFLKKAYESSYSASQASMENAEKCNDVARMILADQFCSPLEAWKQYEAMLRGYLKVKSRKHFLENLHAYTRTAWLPPKLRPIDKRKAAEADRIRLATKTRSFSDYYGEMSKDWRTALRQIASERQFIQDLEEEFGVSMADGEIILQSEGPGEGEA